MLKKLLITLFIVFAGLGMAANVYAAESVRIEQPSTPTGKTSFDITFTALDTTGANMTARCYKKSPTDGSFSQFGSDIALTSTAGGNTAQCNVTPSIVNGNGTYQFYVTVTNGTDNATSETVNVDIETNGPGTPTNYSKSQPDSCTYKIHFRTADDSGKTVKVEIYRNDSTSFVANSSTRVGSVNIGSSTDYDFTSTVGDCTKTYYFVVRAFDSAGNGSGLVGDSQTVTSTTTVNPTTTQQQGAIPVSGNGSGSVLGASTAPTGEVTPTGATEGQNGTQGSNNKKEVKGTQTQSSSLVNTVIIIAVVLAVLAALFVFLRRKSSGR